MFVLIPFFKTKQMRVALLVAAVVLYFLPLQLPEYFCLKEFKSMLIFFSLGCVTWDWKVQLKWLTFVPTYVYFVLFVVLNYMKKQGMMLNLGEDRMVVSLIGIALVISLCRWLERQQLHYVPKTLSMIASSSYIIYLFHTTFEGFAKAIVVKIPMLMNAQNDFFFSIGALTVIVCGTVMPMLLDIYVLRRFKVTKAAFGYS